MKTTAVAHCLWLTIALTLPLRLCAQASPETGAAITTQVDSILNDPSLASGYQGVEIETLAGKHVLYSRNASHVFLPASNNKLLTSSAALALLGPDFRYKTTIYATGPIENGTLKGDIVIVGSGDPTLSSVDLETIAGQVKAAGVSTITGGVDYDASVFDDQWLGDGWTWNDEPAYYSAQIGGLNVDRNVTLVTVKPGARPGDAAVVALTPGATSCIKIENTALTRDSDGKSHIVIDRKRGENTITVSGTIPVDPSMKPVSEAVTFENPPLYTASLLLAALQRSGIAVQDRHVANWDMGKPPGGEIATHDSPKLADILVLMNKPSDNMIAECLLKTIGAAKHMVGTAGGSGTGARSAREWLISIGLEPTQLRQVDGSGLSRHDYVSPDNLVKLLRYWSTDPKGSTLIASLPIAGVDGTLRNRMKGTPAANNCHAKTGSLSQVSCLSGYVTTKDSVPLVFSIMLNNQLGSPAACTAAENKIVELLAGMELGPSNKPEAVGR